jgi:shikimate dehydrogenase
MNAPGRGRLRACVIGWPVAHSRSPMIHNHWLAQYGIDGSYERAAVAPDQFEDFASNLAAHGFIGANVTLPHKEKAFELCAVATETAARLGAVNTLWLEDGCLLGDNTDVPGFLGALDQDVGGWDQRKNTAVVLGAGGAARAIVEALLLRGLERIVVANRTRARAESLASRTGEPVEAGDWELRSELLGGADLLVNTTSLGMRGQEALEIDLAALPTHAIVCDIVYVPLETELLRRAKARGLRGVSGLGMLLHQAVPGFRRWFGRTPVVTTELRRLVEADISPPSRDSSA